MAFILVTIILVSTAVFGKSTVLDLIIISEIHSSTVWSTAPNDVHGYFTDQLTVLSWAWGLFMYAGPRPYSCLVLFIVWSTGILPVVSFLSYVKSRMWIRRSLIPYWRVFLTSQLDFLHILLTSSSFLSLVMGRSLFPLFPVSFSISPMQNSQACVVLLVVFENGLLPKLKYLVKKLFRLRLELCPGSSIRRLREIFIVPAYRYYKVLGKVQR